VRWFLVAQGALAGFVGAVAGVALAVVASRLIPQRMVDDIAGHAVENATTRPLDAVPIVLIGVVVSGIAAWVPARSTARIPTLQALAGRRPLGRVPKRLPLLGAVTAGGGCALLAMAVAGARGGGSALWALVAIAGALAVLLGSIAVAPYAIAGLERLSARFTSSWRLAGRSLTRSRVRSSAVVGAVCAVAITVVVGGTLARSWAVEESDALPPVADNQMIVETYRVGPGPQGEAAEGVPSDVRRRVTAIAPEARWVVPPDVVRSDLAALPEPPTVGVQGVGFDGLPDTSDDEWLEPTVANEEMLSFYKVPPSLRVELRRGRAVVVSRARAYQGPLELVTDNATTGGVPLEVGGRFDSPAAGSRVPLVLMSEPSLDRYGVVSAPGSNWVVATPEPFTSRQRRDLELLGSDLEWESNVVELSTAPGPAPAADGRVSAYLVLDYEDEGLSPATVRAILLGLSLLLVLAVIAVGLALAANDSKDESQVLHAVGAPPKVLRRVSALRAVLLVVVAVMISVPAGLMSAASIVAAADAGSSEVLRFRVDGLGLLFLTIVMPATVGLVVWLGGRARDAIRPPRADVFAFGE
jgi:putative ABC transport system permease protein